MSQQEDLLEQKHLEFIEKSVTNLFVWGLKMKDEDAWATSTSIDFEDVETLPFWSEKEGALECAKEDWDAYEPAQIPLNEFLENWCIGMFQDGILAGTNWDSSLFGKETEPLDLVLEILLELKKHNKTLDLKVYETMEDFEQQVREIIES
jgi:hypothetical protein